MAKDYHSFINMITLRLMEIFFFGLGGGGVFIVAIQAFN